jgi:hypothetical protein
MIGLKQEAPLFRAPAPGRTPTGNPVVSIYPESARATPGPNRCGSCWCFVHDLPALNIESNCYLQKKPVMPEDVACDRFRENDSDTVGCDRCRYFAGAWCATLNVETCADAPGAKFCPSYENEPNG